MNSFNCYIHFPLSGCSSWIVCAGIGELCMCRDRQSYIAQILGLLYFLLFLMV